MLYTVDANGNKSELYLEPKLYREVISKFTVITEEENRLGFAVRLHDDYCYYATVKDKVVNKIKYKIPYS